MEHIVLMIVPINLLNFAIQLVKLVRLVLLLVVYLAMVKPV